MAVDLEKKGHVGVITMNRPEALNALNTPMLQELERQTMKFMSAF